MTLQILAGCSNTELMEICSKQGCKLDSYWAYGLLTVGLHKVKVITINYEKWNDDLAKSRNELRSGHKLI